MAADSLASVGKGIVQINLRLNRVLELLERPASAPAVASEVGEREIALDLIDALERALERPPGRASWWARLLGGGGEAQRDDGLRRGIEVAQRRALERLGRLGVEVIDTSGSFDAGFHEALERLPPPPGVADGMIARTHRTGFVVREGGGVRVLRAAQVSVYISARALKETR